MSGEKNGGGKTKTNKQKKQQKSKTKQNNNKKEINLHPKRRKISHNAPDFHLFTAENR